MKKTVVRLLLILMFMQHAKINNLNNKQMEKYILFHFTDESTLAAPKCDLRINFSNSPYEVVNRLELKLK